MRLFVADEHAQDDGLTKEWRGRMWLNPPNPRLSWRVACLPARFPNWPGLAILARATVQRFACTVGRQGREGEARRDNC